MGLSAYVAIVQIDKIRVFSKTEQMKLTIRVGWTDESGCLFDGVKQTVASSAVACGNGSRSDGCFLTLRFTVSLSYYSLCISNSAQECWDVVVLGLEIR